MRKSILLALVLALCCSFFTIAAMANDGFSSPPVLSLDVKVDPNCKTNVTYIARLNPIPVLTTRNMAPVIAFFL